MSGIAARGVAIVLMLLGATLVAWPGVEPAMASCVGPYGPGGHQSLRQMIARAPVVFVATVTGTTNRARTATVQVDDVWHGRHISRTVIVRGSYVTGNAATTVDRVFETGVRYLFVPEPTSRFSPFQDNNCTATRPFTAGLSKYRPASAHHP